MQIKTDKAHWETNTISEISTFESINMLRLEKQHVTADMVLESHRQTINKKLGRSVTCKSLQFDRF